MITTFTTEVSGEPGPRQAAGAEPLLLGYRNIARSTDERTIICSLLPRVAANNSVLLVRVDPPELDRRLLFLAVISSFAFDYVARNKVGGMNMTYNYFRQFACPRSDGVPLAWRRWTVESVARLLARDGELNDVLPATTPSGEDETLTVRSELDAAMFRVYGIDRDDVDYILDTFPIVRRKDEAKFGEYRTKRLILEAYDRLAAVERETAAA